MDRDNTIARLENIAKHAVHTAGEDTFILSLDDGLAIHEAIEALKAQLTHEGTTSDLISRTETVKQLQGALDVTVPITDYDGGFIDGVEFGVSTVSTMPTIQPQSTTGQLNDGARSTARSTDLIDRQAAIDALDCINGVEEVLRSLPSAQPSTYDLISRQAAIDAIENSSKPYVWQGADIIRNLPTIQPEPQEGHWIRTDCGLDVECKCSKCGYRDFVEPRDEYWFKRNYCPNCGAKMKGAQNG